MSASSSSRVLLPVKRSSFSHRPCDGQLARLLELERLEVVADLGARAAGAHEAQPDRVRPGVRRGGDLDHVAVLELGVQRRLLAVDGGADRVRADVGVDRIGEVDHGRAARHRHDAALGREDVDRLREQVDLDMVPELGGVVRLLLDIEQRLQPLRAEVLCRRAVGCAGLVEPVRRHA